MASPHRLPALDRLSVLIATILLAYASAQFINLPARNLGVQLPGFYLGFELSTNTIIAFLVAGLTASGTHWLLQDHPAYKSNRILQHILLPALTALVIGVPLNNLPLGLTWWVVFIMGGLTLLAVLTAEYIVIDLEDLRQPAATAVLTGLSFALLTILAISLRAAETRLFLLVPPIFMFGGLVSLRSLHLRQLGRWLFPQAAGIALVIAQIATVFHYLPVTPITYGLLVAAVGYSLTVLVNNLSSGRPRSQAILEPGLILIVFIGFALWIR